jgi:uncharacterized protein YneF (UPF0154 family)
MILTLLVIAYCILAFIFGLVAGLFLCYKMFEKEIKLGKKELAKYETL